MDAVERFQQDSDEGARVSPAACVRDVSVARSPTHGFLTSLCVCLSEVLAGCSFSAPAPSRPAQRSLSSPQLHRTRAQTPGGRLEGR